MSARERADAVYETLLGRAGERWVQPRKERTARILAFLDDPQRTYRVVQEARKNAGLDVSDRIVLALNAAPAEAAALETHADLIAAETLAVAHAVRSGGAQLIAAGDSDGTVEYEAVIDAGTYANRGAFTVSVSRTEAST